MATYWKSNPRKMCDICKCWIADNKISIDFHERGKSHQEKKAKFLDGVRKRSYTKAKEEKNLDGYLKQMEKAAAKAYNADRKELGLVAAATSQTVTAVIKQKPVPKRVKQEKSEDAVASFSSKFLVKKEEPEAAPLGKWVPVEEPLEPTVAYVKPNEVKIIEFEEKKHEVKKRSGDEVQVAFKKRKVAPRSGRKRCLD